MHDPVAELNWYNWMARYLDARWNEILLRRMPGGTRLNELGQRKRELEKWPLMVVMRPWGEN